jgi:hypothetical protein
MHVDSPWNEPTRARTYPPRQDCFMHAFNIPSQQLLLMHTLLLPRTHAQNCTVGYVKELRELNVATRIFSA